MKRHVGWSAKVKQATSHRHLLLLAVVCGCIITVGCARYSAQTQAVSVIDGHKALLGGTPAAFNGHPSFLGQGYEYAAATGERVFLWLNEASIPDRGLRVVQLLLEPTNHQPWDAATADRLYRAFFPADAVHLRDVDTAHGTHHLYHSNALAATLPFTFFVDQHGQSLDPGTFDAVCAAGAAAQPSGFACFVAAGMMAL